MPPGSDGVVFVPWMGGAMAPRWDADARGGWYGLTPAHHRAHLCRSLLEGSAYALRDVIDAIRGAGLEVERIVCVAGGARSALVRQLRADVTGLPQQFILNANLRVTADRFRKELLRDKRLTIGRLDGRFTSIDADAAGERQEYDISNSALQGPYTSMFQEYVKNDLKWETDLHYPTSGNVRPWTYDQNRYMDMTEPLRSAMTHNPFLKVFVAIGYYDMATIMGGAEFNFTHLAYDKQVTDRVSHGYYEAGHMIYIRPSAHKALKNDVAKFIQGTRAQGASRTTSQP